MITRVKGTQDILNLQLRNFLLNKIREHLQKYNFAEILTPILERTELFLRTVGEQTDIVSKEIYFVSSKEHHEEDICLRPELTAPVMRAFLNGSVHLTPWKVFTYGPLFRHERPQKGRFREFYQVSAEVIGASSPAGDAYFIAMLDRLFSQELKLDSYALIINFVGCPEDRVRYKEVLRTFLAEHASALCQLCMVRQERNILRILDCKIPACQALYKSAPVITDSLCSACAHEWQLIGRLLTELSIVYTHVPQLVRGLDYYNKVVFEFIAHQALGAQSAFCAGGRYDMVARQLGSSQDYSAIGAGLGIERLVLLLEAHQEQLPLLALPALHIIIPLAEEQQALALHLADELHAHNLRIDVFLETGSLKSMMRKADARQAATCLLIGSDEQQNHTVTVKNMKTGEESRVQQTQVAEMLAKIS